MEHTTTGTEPLVFQERGWYLPASIISFFDSQEIDALDLVLLGRINSLIHPIKGCWAGNNYFSEWLRVDERTISRRIAHLNKLGILRVEMRREGKNRGTKRRLFIETQGDHLMKHDHRTRLSSSPAHDHRTRLSSGDYALLHKAYTPVAPLRRGPRHEGFFELNGSKKKVTNLPYKEEAVSLTKTFHRKLVEHHLHLNRADLPKGHTPRAKAKRQSTFKKWMLAASALLQQVDGDLDHIDKVLEWYFAHRRNTYVADVRAMSTFCDKFFRLEKVMHQEEGVREPSPRIKVEVDR